MTNDQINLKSPTQSVNPPGYWTLGIGTWSFTGHWSLVIGHFYREMSASLRRRLRGKKLLGLIVFCLVLVGSALAAGDDIPSLRPPRAELRPTFWEQHGWQIVLAAVLFAGLTAFFLTWRRGPKPSVIIPPEALARAALEALRGQAEDVRVIAEISRILRHYAIAAFALPPGELTTTEIQKALKACEANPELANDVICFLRDCDEWKFGPFPSASRVGAVARALELVEKIQTNRKTPQQPV